jgi:hypothetical protein
MGNPPVMGRLSLNPLTFTLRACCITAAAWKGEFQPLGQIQPSVEGDLPAVVGVEAAAMDAGAGVDVSGEWRAGALERVLDLPRVLQLLLH